MHFSHAQNSILPLGARANALGNSSVCLRDVWSVFNNPGDLGRVESLQSAATYDYMAGFPTFNRMAIAFTMPLKSGGVGAGFYRFGDDLYSEQMFSAGYGNTIGNTSLGIRTNIIQYRVQEFGNKNLVSLSFGGITTLTPWLTLGGYIHNINQPEISEGERLETIMTSGAIITISEKTRVLTEVEKKINYPVTLRTGFEYNIHAQLVLRTGFNVKPNAGFFGIGVKKKKLHFDYAYTWITSFASRHQCTLQYNLRTKK